MKAGKAVAPHEPKIPLLHVTKVVLTKTMCAIRLPPRAPKV